MTKGILSVLIWIWPFLLLAQNKSSTQPILTEKGPGMTDGKGIQWISGLSWEQIKQKAKIENKYIFIDAYTTWCGPCKMMDKSVYLNDSVGYFFNEHFVAVKAQMDVTDKDDQSIKNWYGDAKTIEKEFVVRVYPSLIFLSPDANILEKKEGYKPVQEFISIAKEALIPSKIYDNPFLEYKTLVDEYKKGIKHYDRMPFMIHKALELNDPDFARNLFHEYLEYESNLSENERYTKENIEVWSLYTLKLDSKALSFFLKDADKIDKVMNQKGYSTDIVDKTIQARIVDSFYRMQKGETTISGVKMPNSEIMFVQLAVRSDGKPWEIDYVEADWKQLEKMIKRKFNSDYAIRNVLTARSRWYEQHQNRVGALKVYFTRLAEWPPVKLELATNDFAWHTFLYTNDKKLLKEASEWQGKLIQQWPGRHELLDTYGSILYKLGRFEEAIRWEKKALEIVSTGNKIHSSDRLEEYMKTYEDVIEKMKMKKPTYLEQGAIWTNK